MNLIAYISTGNVFKLSFGLLLVGSVLMMLMGSLRKLFSKNKKKAILYALFLLLTFGLAGLLSSSKVLDNTPLHSFIAFQIVFLGLGILHIYVLRTFFNALSDDQASFFSEFLFSVAVLCIGLFAFVNVVGMFRSNFSLIFMASAFWFIIPFMVYKLFEFSQLIPVPIYNKWFFPINENIKDPTSKELENPLVISFEFQKKFNDELTNFKVKAPESMEFGKLFYFFITDYNERHPESQIIYLDQKTQQPQGWIFYVKPKFWKSIQPINFSKTVAGNNIKEDDVVMCQRTD